MKKSRFTMNLQLFADPAGDNGGGSAGDGQQGAAGTGQGTGQQGTEAPQIDYARIQQMLNGTLAAKEDTALKAYFKQQGLTQEEAEKAMAAFKAEKAKNQPDVEAMQAQITSQQETARRAQIEAAATLAAVTLGINAKTIPYVLKLADFSQAVGQDGKINTETVNSALKKVLEDVPALKPQTAGANGFVQVGASGSDNSGQAGSQAEQLAAIFGNDKK